MDINKRSQVFNLVVSEENAKVFHRAILPAVMLLLGVNLLASIFPVFYPRRVTIEILCFLSLLPAVVIAKRVNYVMAFKWVMGLITITLSLAVWFNGGVLAPAFIALLISTSLISQILSERMTIIFACLTSVLGFFAIFLQDPVDYNQLPPPLYYWINYSTYGALLVIMLVMMSRVRLRLMHSYIEGEARLFGALSVIREPLLLVSTQNEIIRENSFGKELRNSLEAEFTSPLMEIDFLLPDGQLKSLQSLINQASTHPFHISLSREGQVAWYQLSVYHLEDEAGAILVFRDDNSSRAMMHAQKMEAVSQLASGMAHEYNNMLGAIAGAIDLIKLDEPELNSEYLEIIEEATSRATNLTKQLLMFTRRRPQFTELVDVHMQIAHAVEFLKRTSEKRFDIQLELNADKHTVVGDHGLLFSALLNLGVNSAQAIEGYGSIIFRTSAHTFTAYELEIRWPKFELEAGSYLMIEVIDDGQGIDPRYIESIFDPFFTTRDQHDSGGLGLTAVYGAVIKHGGAIAVRSVLGKGSQFELILPAQKGQSAVTRRVSALSKELDRSLRVLVIDDEEIVRQTISKLLESTGCQVVSASGGKEGLAYFKAEEFDLVILDVIMPEMGGLDVLKEIRREDSLTPVLLSSGYSRDEDLEELTELGVSGLLNKPYRRAELIAKINQLLTEESISPSS